MLIDTTLREGCQAYGVYFDMETKRGIFRSLLAAEIEEIEIGCVGSGHLEELLPWARQTINASGAPAHVSVWCRLREDDLELARTLGVRRINIGAPVSAEHLEKRLSLSRRGLFCRLERVLGRAVDMGFDYISVGLEDAGRADPHFALEAARLAAAQGASRIRLSDTVGVLSPPEIMEMVRMFSMATKKDIAVHCHNDFGMATANAVAALEAGAQFADASVLGLGERAGITAIEEAAAFLALRRDRDYGLGILAELARTVAKTAKMEIPRNKAVAGRDIFSCESGLHVHGLYRDPSLYEPYAPELVGAERIIAGGGKSGMSALREHLSLLGIHVDADCAPAVVRAVRQEAENMGRPLSDVELRALARKTLAAMRVNKGKAA